MNTQQLLVSREKLGDNWYSALSIFREYKSVERTDFYNTCSSAGDWEGYIVQKIGNKRYLILFSQENQMWHGGGYKIYTDDKPIASWNGKFTEDEVLSILSDIFDWA